MLYRSITRRGRRKATINGADTEAIQIKGPQMNRDAIGIKGPQRQENGDYEESG